MIRHSLPTVSISLAAVLLLSAVIAPGVLAKGKPTRVEITQASCGSVTADVSWWKKLDVHEVRALAYFNGSFQQIQDRTSTNAFTSPQTITFGSLPFSGAVTTYRVDVFLYSDTAAQNQLDSGTASISFNCAI
jgi:hypothetical protein